MKDFYLTIGGESRSEIKVKASRFIAESFIAPTVLEAESILKGVRKREYNANHHCYAYKIGFSGEQFKYSDDGEPNGTAGKPIFDLLAGNNLTNLICIVTRYFGGTKLGTGGLVRAYSEAAAAVLKLSGRKQVFFTNSYKVKINFPLYDRWLLLLKKFDTKIEKSEFAESVTMIISIRKSYAQQLIEAFVELTSAQGEIELIDDETAGV